MCFQTLPSQTCFPNETKECNWSSKPPIFSNCLAYITLKDSRNHLVSNKVWIFYGIWIYAIKSVVMILLTDKDLSWKKFWTVHFHYSISQKLVQQLLFYQKILNTGNDMFWNVLVLLKQVAPFNMVWNTEKSVLRLQEQKCPTRANKSLAKVLWVLGTFFLTLACLAEFLKRMRIWTPKHNRFFNWWNLGVVSHVIQESITYYPSVYPSSTFDQTAFRMSKFSNLF